MTESQVKSAIYDWLTNAIGTRQVFTITFDADFVTGNVINASFNGTPIAAVNFDTDHDTTMESLALEIQDHVAIYSTDVTAARVITCTAKTPGQTVTVTGPTTTGGASQPVATLATTTAAQAVIVIFADQTAPRPAKPYATIRVLNVEKIGGQDDWRDTDDEGFQTIAGWRQMTLSLNTFGNSALDHMQQALNSLNKPTVISDLSQGGIAVIDKGPLQNLTTLLETTFEPRAQMDLTVSFAEEYTDDVGYIDTVEVNEEIIAID